MASHSSEVEMHVLRRIATIALTSATIVGGGSFSVAYASPAPAPSPQGPSANVPGLHRAENGLNGSVHRPQVMRTKSNNGSVSPNSSVSGNTCYYYPPNYYRALESTGDSDTPAYGGGTFNLYGTGSITSSSTLGGSDEGHVYQEVGEAVIPSGFPSGSSITVHHDWYYDGVLKAYSEISPIPYYGGKSTGTASMQLYVNFLAGNSGQEHLVASRSLTNDLGAFNAEQAEVYDSGQLALTQPIYNNITYVSKMRLNLNANITMSALTNASASAVFEGQYGGANLGAFEGNASQWDYNLPAGYYIASCG